MTSYLCLRLMRPALYQHNNQILQLQPWLMLTSFHKQSTTLLLFLISEILLTQKGGGFRQLLTNFSECCECYLSQHAANFVAQVMEVLRMLHQQVHLYLEAGEETVSTLTCGTTTQQKCRTLHMALLPCPMESNISPLTHPKFPLIYSSWHRRNCYAIAFMMVVVPCTEGCSAICQLWQIDPSS